MAANNIPSTSAPTSWSDFLVKSIQSNPQFTKIGDAIAQPIPTPKVDTVAFDYLKFANENININVPISDLPKDKNGQIQLPKGAELNTTGQGMEPLNVKGSIIGDSGTATTAKITVPRGATASLAGLYPNATVNDNQLNALNPGGTDSGITLKDIYLNSANFNNLMANPMFKDSAYGKYVSQPQDIKSDYLVSKSGDNKGQFLAALPSQSATFGNQDFLKIYKDDLVKKGANADSVNQMVANYFIQPKINDVDQYQKSVLSGMDNFDKNYILNDKGLSSLDAISQELKLSKDSLDLGSKANSLINDVATGQRMVKPNGDWLQQNATNPLENAQGKLQNVTNTLDQNQIADNLIVAGKTTVNTATNGVKLLLGTAAGAITLGASNMVGDKTRVQELKSGIAQAWIDTGSNLSNIVQGKLSSKDFRENGLIPGKTTDKLFEVGTGLKSQSAASINFNIGDVKITNDSLVKSTNEVFDIASQFLVAGGVGATAEGLNVAGKAKWLADIAPFALAGKTTDENGKALSTSALYENTAATYVTLAAMHGLAKGATALTTKVFPDKMGKFYQKLGEAKGVGVFDKATAEELAKVYTPAAADAIQVGLNKLVGMNSSLGRLSNGLLQGLNVFTSGVLSQFLVGSAIASVKEGKGVAVQPDYLTNAVYGIGFGFAPGYFIGDQRYRSQLINDIAKNSTTTVTGDLANAAQIITDNVYSGTKSTSLVVNKPTGETSFKTFEPKAFTDGQGNLVGVNFAKSQLLDAVRKELNSTNIPSDQIKGTVTVDSFIPLDKLSVPIGKELFRVLKDPGAKLFQVTVEVKKQDAKLGSSNSDGGSDKMTKIIAVKSDGTVVPEEKIFNDNNSKVNDAIKYEEVIKPLSTLAKSGVLDKLIDSKTQFFVSPNREVVYKIGNEYSKFVDNGNGGIEPRIITRFEVRDLTKFDTPKAGLDALFKTTFSNLAPLVDPTTDVGKALITGDTKEAIKLMLPTLKVEQAIQDQGGVQANVKNPDKVIAPTQGQTVGKELVDNVSQADLKKAEKDPEAFFDQVSQNLMEKGGAVEMPNTAAIIYDAGENRQGAIDAIQNAAKTALGKNNIGNSILTKLPNIGQYYTSDPNKTVGIVYDAITKAVNNNDQYSPFISDPETFAIIDNALKSTDPEQSLRDIIQQSLDNLPDKVVIKPIKSAEVKPTTAQIANKPKVPEITKVKVKPIEETTKTPEEKAINLQKIRDTKQLEKLIDDTKGYIDEQVSVLKDMVDNQDQPNQVAKELSEVYGKELSQDIINSVVNYAADTVGIETALELIDGAKQNSTVYKYVFEKIEKTESSQDARNADNKQEDRVDWIDSYVADLIEKFPELGKDPRPSSVYENIKKSIDEKKNLIQQQQVNLKKVLEYRYNTAPSFKEEWDKLDKKNLNQSFYDKYGNDILNLKTYDNNTTAIEQSNGQPSSNETGNEPVKPTQEAKQSQSTGLLKGLELPQGLTKEEATDQIITQWKQEGLVEPSQFIKDLKNDYQFTPTLRSYLEKGIDQALNKGTQTDMFAEPTIFDELVKNGNIIKPQKTSQSSDAVMPNDDQNALGFELNAPNFSNEIKYREKESDKSWKQVELQHDTEGNVLAPNGERSLLGDSLAKDLKLLAEKIDEVVAKTRTPEFKKWFGDSKVVDVNGEPLIVYHGTNADFNEFDLSYSDKGENSYGLGFYFTTNKDTAESYVLQRGGNSIENGQITPSFLNLPKFIDGKEDSSSLSSSQIEKLIKLNPDYKEVLYDFGDVDYLGEKKVLSEVIDTIKQNLIFYQINNINNDFYNGEAKLFAGNIEKITGYGGAMFKMGTGETFITVFNPNQIKSVFNEGQFSPETNDTRYRDSNTPEQAIYGAAYTDAGQATIALNMAMFKDNNLDTNIQKTTTLIHETAHHFVESLSSRDKSNFLSSVDTFNGDLSDSKNALQAEEKAVEYLALKILTDRYNNEEAKIPETSDFATSMWQRFKDFLGKIWDGIKNLFSGVKNSKTKLGEVLQEKARQYAKDNGIDIAKLDVYAKQYDKWLKTPIKEPNIQNKTLSEKTNTNFSLENQTGLNKVKQIGQDIKSSLEAQGIKVNEVDNLTKNNILTSSKFREEDVQTIKDQVEEVRKNTNKEESPKITPTSEVNNNISKAKAFIDKIPNGNILKQGSKSFVEGIKTLSSVPGNILSSKIDSGKNFFNKAGFDESKLDILRALEFDSKETPGALYRNKEAMDIQRLEKVRQVSKIPLTGLSDEQMRAASVFLDPIQAKEGKLVINPYTVSQVTWDSLDPTTPQGKAALEEKTKKLEDQGSVMVNISIDPALKKVYATYQINPELGKTLLKKMDKASGVEKQILRTYAKGNAERTDLALEEGIISKANVNPAPMNIRTPEQSLRIKGLSGSSASKGKNTQIQGREVTAMDFIKNGYNLSDNLKKEYQKYTQATYKLSALPAILNSANKDGLPASIPINAFNDLVRAEQDTSFYNETLKLPGVGEVAINKDLLDGLHKFDLVNEGTSVGVTEIIPGIIDTLTSIPVVNSLLNLSRDLYLGIFTGIKNVTMDTVSALVSYSSNTASDLVTGLVTDVMTGGKQGATPRNVKSLVYGAKTLGSFWTHNFMEIVYPHSNTEQRKNLRVALGMGANSAEIEIGKIDRMTTRFESDNAFAKIGNTAANIIDATSKIVQIVESLAKFIRTQLVDGAILLNNSTELAKRLLDQGINPLEANNLEIAQAARWVIERGGNAGGAEENMPGVYSAFQKTSSVANLISSLFSSGEQVVTPYGWLVNNLNKGGKVFQGLGKNIDTFRGKKGSGPNGEDPTGKERVAAATDSVKTLVRTSAQLVRSMGILAGMIIGMIAVISGRDADKDRKTFKDVTMLDPTVGSGLGNASYYGNVFPWFDPKTNRVVLINLDRTGEDPVSAVKDLLGKIPFGVGEKITGDKPFPKIEKTAEQQYAAILGQPFKLFEDIAKLVSQQVGDTGKSPIYASNDKTTISSMAIPNILGILQENKLITPEQANVSGKTSTTYVNGKKVTVSADLSPTEKLLNVFAGGQVIDPQLVNLNMIKTAQNIGAGVKNVENQLKSGKITQPEAIAEIKALQSKAVSAGLIKPGTPLGEALPIMSSYRRTTSSGGSSGGSLRSGGGGGIRTSSIGSGSRSSSVRRISSSKTPRLPKIKSLKIGRKTKSSRVRSSKIKSSRKSTGIKIPKIKSIKAIS